MSGSRTSFEDETVAIGRVTKGTESGGDLESSDAKRMSERSSSPGGGSTGSAFRGSELPALSAAVI